MHNHYDYDVKRIDLSRGIIRAQSGFECRFTLDRDRHSLTGEIKVSAPNGVSQCVTGWRAALALADKYAENAHKGA